MLIYVVKEGDTIARIANETQSSVERIRMDNALMPDSVLVPGQALLILTPSEVYTVAEGDTLSLISAQSGIDKKQLLANNPSFIGRDILYPGETIVLSYEGQENRREILVNGYTYPSVNRNLLRKTLPYLSFLTIFTYGFTPEGDLVVPEDEELIQIAGEYEVAPIMLLSTLSPAGTFSNELSSAIFANAEARNRLYDRILTTLREKGYYGLDVDFEYVFPEEREAYVQFLQELKERLAAEGFLLITALAPKTSADQRGLLYEAHDYGAIGQVTDYVLLMTYEWGYTYGPPMAVAPLNKVKQVLDYGVSEITPDKILQGIPNYGYDWTLPFVRDVSKARSVGNVEAVELAARYRTEILFDETAASPYFYYTDATGREHVVWFEDVRSIQAKLDLNASYPLAGVSYWNIMREFPQNWNLLNQMVKVKNLVGK